MATTLGNGNSPGSATSFPSVNKEAATSTVSALASFSKAAVAAISSSASSTSYPTSSEEQMELQLSVELFNLITMNHNEIKNVIVSPLLLESMLALLYLGSDGATAQQLKTILQLKRFNVSNNKMAQYYVTHLEIATRDSDTKLQLSQIILMQEHFQIAEEFKRIAMKYFHTLTTTAKTTNSTPAPAYNKNMEISKNIEKMKNQINDLLSKITIGPLKKTVLVGEVKAAKPSTNNKSTDSNDTNATSNGTQSSNIAVISPVVATTKTQIDINHGEDNGLTFDGIVVLAANFIYKWFLPFSAYRSGFYDFHSSSNSENDVTLQSEKMVTKPVPMLFDDDMFVKFAEFRDLDARAIELPYECDVENELSMLLILPNQKDGLPSLLGKLKSVNLNALTDSMQMENVQVLLPKFSLEFECSLKKYLEQLGLESIFTEEANFNNLLSKDNQMPLRIADVVQKFKISVNESGSEESNIHADKPLVLSNAFTSKKKFFRAEHPFYFAIRNPEVTYFIGCIQNL